MKAKTIVLQKEKSGDYTATRKDGRTITTGFSDWTMMRYLVDEMVTEENLPILEARKKFWENVRENNPGKFDLAVSDYDSVEEAISNGALDELRNDYLFCSPDKFNVVIKEAA